MCREGVFSNQFPKLTHYIPFFGHEIEGSDAQHPDEADRQSKAPNRGAEMGQSGVTSGGPSNQYGNNAGNANQHGNNTGNSTNYGNTGTGSGTGYGYGERPCLGEGTFGTNYSRVIDSHHTTGSTAGQRGDGVPMHPIGHNAV